MDNQTPLLELKGITKTFGSFTANEDINLTVYPGEVHALLGENGAGKSTLMNVISGIYKPDRGEVFLSGKPVRIHSPKDALLLICNVPYTTVPVPEESAPSCLGQGGTR